MLMSVALVAGEVGVSHSDHADNHEAVPVEGVVEDEVPNRIILTLSYAHGSLTVTTTPTPTTIGLTVERVPFWWGKT